MQGDVVVFIASRHSGPAYRRVLWRTSEADARKICSDPRTSGRNHMLCWTAQYIDDPEVNRYVRDTGTYAQVLADHHVSVLRSFADTQRHAR